MRARKLKQILTKNPYTRRVFLGVYPSCKVPVSKRKSYCFISNTQSHEKTGKHWVVWFIKNDRVLFFDSFGRSPYNADFPHSFMDMAERFQKCSYVAKPVQHPSSAWCGLHCMHFIFMLAVGLSVDEFLKNYEKNDIVKLFNFIFSK